MSPFGDPVASPPAALPPGTLRISALAERIHGALKAAFPKRVWIVGETAELERGLHRQHWFFRLVEKEAADGKRYALGAVIWGFDQKRLFGPGGTLSGVLEPKDGVEIRACVDVDFYGPNGDLRLVVRDIDPAYTLGKLALERQQLIEKLTKEGVLARQKSLATPELPLRIGVISSENSAAANDFLKEIARFGFAFEILFFDARMQGEDTVRTVSRGLTILERRGVDAIAVVRGGGSTVDLAWFDKEALVRAIAACRVPVLTGIGHEIDTSVADLAAHLSFKTPTAVASWFNERAQDALSWLREAVRRLTELGERPRDELEALGITTRRIADLVLAAVREEQVRLGSARVALRRSPRATTRLERERVAARLRRLRVVPLAQRLAAERESAARAGGRVERVVTEELRRAAERLAHAESRTRLLDPANVLRRGFAILRGSDGKTLKDAAAARPGDRIVAMLRDGDLAARVEKTPRGDVPRPRPQTGGRDGETKDGCGDGPRQLAIW